MPISFTPISNVPHWAGSSWTIVNEDLLAQMIARVALGQSRYVGRVLSQLGVTNIKPSKSALQGALKLLHAPDPNAPWHRDGWMFQVISWIAAHLQSPGDLIAYPHMIHAHKGFDGMHVKIDVNTGLVALVVICEEKATENPRTTVNGAVWPEFRNLQRGDRVNELTAQVTQLLEQRGGLDIDGAIEKIIWADAQAYRVSITIDDSHNSANGHKRLFDGFEGIVNGGVERRRGEVLYQTNLRPWMATLASKAKAHATLIGS